MAEANEITLNNPDKTEDKKNLNSIIVTWAIFILAIVAGILIYEFIFGASANFIGGDPAGDPVQGGTRQFLGIIYKGGFVVPILLALVIINIAFAIERFLTITKANGKGNINAFLTKIRKNLEGNKIDETIAACDVQKGSVANVVKSTLIKYKEMDADTSKDLEQRVAAIEKEVEEATNLELPMLEKNLSIISTIASISTLIALFGTVLGMIRAFAALGTGGAPDSAQLATGISEALVNTAFGIANAALAIILYNVFTTRIDKITYAIDEASYSNVQTFVEKHK